MDNTLVFVGQYTNYSVLPHWPYGNKEGEGIHCYRWLSEQGKLELLSVTPALNPAVLKYHPKLNVLYALTECIDTEGVVTAYKVDPSTGTLTEFSSIQSTGRSTCYISIDKDAKQAIISNYWDGKLNVIELDEEGGLVRVVHEHQQTNREAWRQVENRDDHMANRQDGPHAHCNVFHPSYRWMFVPDLGDNCIYQYGVEGSKLVPQGHAALEKGFGPRHFVFHPTLPVAYSGCELRNCVQVFAIDESEPEVHKVRVQPVQQLTTLPPDFDRRNYVSEIKVDRTGRFLYCSNRGHHSIAIYSIDQDSGWLTPVSIDPTLGKTPRHFGISPDGQHLVAADQDSDYMKVFRIHPGKGTLEYTGEQVDLGTPCFVLFQTPYSSS